MVQVSAEEHTDFNTVIFIQSGTVNFLTAFLQVELVTITWTVTPTLVPTEFVITATSTFVTNVPV